jgi:ABC-2 type transport system ATP-binding protein
MIAHCQASVISVQNLSKTYEYHKKQPGFKGSILNLVKRKTLFTNAVKNINFDIKEGELVGFLGPNGAGKTTTLKMLSGILYPTSGTAQVLGFIPWQRKKEYLKQISLVMGQKAQLWWDLPARESMLLSQAIYEIPNREFKKRLDWLSALLDVKRLLDVQVRKLSLGQRMKMELIIALIHQPKVLFLDEPTIGLDVVAQKIMRDFLLEYNQKQGTTILLTSHYMEDVEALCKRVIVINKGEIIYDGQLSNLVKKYANCKILKLTFLQEVAKEDLKPFGKILHFDPIKAELKVPRTKTKEIAIAILQKLPVDDILIDEIKVDEVVRGLFSGNQ